MIELRGVTKTFGARKAVDHLDLGVRAGELFAFLGPNGAGKTTTIKMVCGLLRPTSGEVRVGGYPAASPQARPVEATVRATMTSIGPTLSRTATTSMARSAHRVPRGRRTE
jgi:ABC-2 type transport system ATP-binding protein